ncbi:MAG: hypothetical protein FIA99_14190 [Ruminiclostridium sp.]|nr:hypothetical protein [Ruminiclostridium sp.]
MFGYILPEKPEMKIKEYELFRAYYCGVCKALGSRSGQLKRFLLNYDSAFLAVLLTAVAGEIPVIKRETCVAHPIVKRHVVKRTGIIDYASDFNVLLAYYNLEDDRQDEGSAISLAGTVLLRRTFKKLKKIYSEKCDIIESRLRELNKLENDRCASMDMAAEPFAKLMEEVTAYEPLCREKKTCDILRWIGYNLGKWIYILDAYDDIEDDIKQKSYNPLVSQFGYEDGAAAGFKKRIRDRVEFTLTYSLDQIAKAFELLEVKNNAGILENIIYMGMLRKTEKILGTGSCRKVE